MKKTLSMLLCVLLLLAAGALPASAQAEEPPVKLSVMKSKGIEIWDPENNPALAQILSDMNVEIDFQAVDDITTSINLGMASGELCDIIVAPKFTFMDYVDSGYLLELDGLLEQYGSNLTSTISQEAWDYVRLNGHVYCVPQENLNAKFVTAIRKDWLTNLGYEVKDEYTLSELKEILIAFAKNDPDQNGKDDTYAMNGFGGGWATVPMAIYGAFGGVTDQYYLNDSNEFYAFNTSDDFRAALTYLNELWTAGAIDPEFFVAANDQARLKATNGRIGYFSSWWSGPKELYENGFAEINPEGGWQKITVCSDDGSKSGMRDNGLITNTTFISSTCENPEKAMEFLNYLSSDEGYALANYGMKGVHYELDEEGKVSTIFAQNRDWTPLASITRRLDQVVFHDAAQVADDASEADKTIYQFQMIQYERDVDLYADVFYGLPVTQESIEYNTELTNFVTTKVVEFITGEEEINDENWEAYRAEWISKGGKKILESYAKLYNESKGTQYTVAN